jgi:outer membrane receptor protein involved in Fe transport
VRQHFTSSQGDFFSPSAGLAYGGRRFRLRASAYRAFRTPTLNELHREFRAGNAVTQANAELRPEKVFGVEAGADWVGESRRLNLTLFRNKLTDLITNVTLSSSPTQIIRQRRNAAAALNRGIEVELRQRWGDWRGQVAYLFADSRFSSRERIPQVPRHHGSAELTFLSRWTLVTAGLRSYSLQFEDELNRSILPGFATAYFMASRQLGPRMAAFVAVENFFDREYLTAFNPATIGAPRMWRAGARWELTP